jgi:glycosyltransferase involved in cell wall biosynthesis
MLAKELSERGHDVTLFAHPASTSPVRKVGWPGLCSGKLTDTIKNSAILGAHVISNGTDIVHSFSRIAYLSPILPIKVPKLMSYQREINVQTASLADKLALGTMEFSALSKNMIEFRPLSGKWHLVPNGVPLELYQFRCKVPADAPLVFLGRVELIKGPHLAIEIAKRSNKNLIIAGNIPWEHKRWFDEMIAPHIDNDRVRYIGPVDDRQKNHLLGSAAALLMPILWEEPFGIVMVEAMACGTPVLGMNQGSVSEVVDHGVTGYVGQSPEELSRYVADISALDRRKCRQKVIERYSAHAICDHYLSIYAGLKRKLATK